MTLTSYAGTFEAHLTVAPLADLPASQRFTTVCMALGVKAVVIELPPETALATQPMTASYHRGEGLQVLDEVRRLAAALTQAGFPPLRLKLEAMAHNRGVPQEDAAARALPADNYFEYHGKVVLSTRVGATSQGPLRALCATHGAHLSRNARKQRPDGLEERFVTARYYGCGRATAEARFRGLEQALRTAGFSLHHRLREYSIYDSNAGLDHGWLEGL